MASADGHASATVDGFACAVETCTAAGFEVGTVQISPNGSTDGAISPLRPSTWFVWPSLTANTRPSRSCTEASCASAETSMAAIGSTIFAICAVRPLTAAILPPDVAVPNISSPSTSTPGSMIGSSTVMRPASSGTPSTSRRTSLTPEPSRLASSWVRIRARSVGEADSAARFRGTEATCDASTVTESPTISTSDENGRTAGASHSLGSPEISARTTVVAMAARRGNQRTSGTRWVQVGSKYFSENFS